MKQLVERTGGRVRRFACCEEGIAAIEFAIIAPILLALVFGIVVYAVYFSAFLGVRHAAAEGARAAVAGLSTTERTTLATARAQQVITGFGGFLGQVTPTVTAGLDPAGTGLFRVKVSYNIASSPIMRYRAFVPLPQDAIEATVTVTNGSY